MGHTGVLICQCRYGVDRPKTITSSVGLRSLIVYTDQGGFGFGFGVVHITSGNRYAGIQDNDVILSRRIISHRLKTMVQLPQILQMVHVSLNLVWLIMNAFSVVVILCVRGLPIVPLMLL